MSHISSIGAAMFTDLSVAVGTVTGGVVPATPADPALFDLSATGFTTTFAATKFARIKNVREFPAIGSPANIVSVPVYGQKQGQSIGGQADAPSLEVTINYVPSEWAKDLTAAVPEAVLGKIVGDGISRWWRFTLLSSAPTTYESTIVTGNTGIGAVQNSQYFFKGKLESLLVTPSLTDATTATISISVQSDFYGAFTSGA
jgi:hypothetical protein